MSDFSPCSFGNIVHKVEALGCRFSETRHVPGTCLTRHDHPPATLNFVVDGIYCESLTATPGAVDRFEVLHKPPHEPHANYFGSRSAACLLIEFEPDRFENLRSDHTWLARTHVARGARVKSAGLRLFSAIRNLNRMQAVEAESLFLDFMDAINQLEAPRRATTMPRWLLEVEECLRENPMEDLSVTSIAKTFGKHPSHLAREFKRHYQITVGEFVRRTRLDMGAELLATTRLPISDIAQQCRFSDQSHLGRSFRSRYHQTPQLFRQMCQHRP